MAAENKPQNETDPSWSQLLVDRVTDYAIFRLTSRGEVATWNPGAERIKGYRADEILGKHFSVFYQEEDRLRGIPDNALRQAQENGRYESEGWRIRKDGTVFWASVVITALLDQYGTPDGFGKIVRDISDKRAAYEAVIDSERRFRLLVQGVTDYAIFMLSPEGYVTNWNQGAFRIKGYSAAEVIGSHFSRFYTAEDISKGAPQRGLEIAAREGRFETEGWRVRRDGSAFWAHVVIDAIRDDSGELVGFAKITRDVTERRRAEEQLDHTRTALFQAHKMEALGKLTGGVAHDFNNVLQVLRGNLELLEGRHGRDPWTRERLNKAIEAVEHGATLASQLLAFGRRQPLQPVVANLAAMLRGMDDLLRRALGEEIQIETIVVGGLWNTFADTHQLESVVLNLAINARDAMPDGGKLTLELSNAVLDDHYRALAADVVEGQYVMLGITDTGIGMSQEVQERAFDPFFTTKPEGQGTGLGLSMAYGFVKQSGGHIKIYSEPGQGTTVKVYLPRSTETAVEVETSTRPPVAGGRETILVVEDDRKVQTTVIDTLAQLGYTVLKADDAQSALAIIQSGVHIDLLFTDVVMPGPLRSPDMARQAVRALPHLKVLFTSGYTQNAIVHGGRLDPGVELLSKPYSREQLATKIRRILESPAAVDAQDSVRIEAEPAVAPQRSSGTARKLNILLVDDDCAAREATNELLGSLGYTVTQAGTAEDAAIALRIGPIDVLLTDITLPGQSGIELARTASALYAGLKIVLASGGDVPNPEALGFRYDVLRKPYTLEQLHDAIETAHTRPANRTDGN
ncbi:PAS domain S-box protein [Paraburkholderia sediminicola]|nr:PAS domain S-box protein [Paraburkholderia sediminicola]